MGHQPQNCLSSFNPKVIRQVLVVSGVNLITFNTGYGIGLTSPMLGQLTGLYLDEDNFSWFASSLVIGQIIGSLVGSTIANSLGRKKTCMLAALFSSCGWAMLAASQNFWMLIVARIITGLFDCLAIPGGYMYISEVSETRLKGSFLNSNAIASGLGIAFGYLFGSNFLWRYTCFVALLVNASGIMTFLLCYESPVFLLMKNQSARDCLNWYRELSYETKEYSQELEQELKELESDISSEGQGVKMTLGKLLQGSNLKAFLTVMMLFVFFPLCGVYNITFFAVDLFKKLELGGAETVAVMTALIRCLGTCASTVLMLKFGRRAIYLTTSATVTLVMATLGGLIMVRDSGTDLDEVTMSWVLTILLMLFMFCAGLAVVSFPWVFMAEWFSPDLKSVVSTFSITCSFFMIFLAVQTSNMILGWLGTAGLFFYFSGICGLMTLFIAICVPETGGKMYSQR